MTNTETHKQALIAESQTIQQRWYAIQQELAEIKRAEHAANHADLHADSLRRQQAALQQQAELEAKRQAATAAADAAWRAKQPDVMEAKRLARYETDMMFGKPAPIATPNK